MHRMFHLALRGARVLSASAALLVCAGRVHAQEAPDTTARANLPLASPEPVLQLSSPGLLGDEGIVQEPRFPAETRRKMYPNRPLLATGATLFGLSYMPSVIGAAAVDEDENDDLRDLYYPVAGPWMVLANEPEESRGEKTLLALSGAVQGLGALMLLSSFFVPERVTERWFLIGGKSRVRLGPSRVAGSYGLDAVGRF